MDLLIKILHSIIVILVVISPFINNNEHKRLSFLFLIFVVFHYITKYGKCGLINIERLFLKDRFKEGIIYKFIKPIIGYKNNFFYENLFWLLIIYIFVLFYQLKNNGQKIFPIYEILQDLKIIKK